MPRRCCSSPRRYAPPEREGCFSLALFLVGVIPLLCWTARGFSADLGFIGPDPASRTSQAVVVKGTPCLAHTSQLLPMDERGQLVGKDDLEAQVRQLLDNLARLLRDARAEPADLVKLNVFLARDELAARFSKLLAQRLPEKARPALCLVTTPLPNPDALVALDAVFISPENPAGVRHERSQALPGHPGPTRLALLPHGKRVYVAGQAEKGDTLPEATRKTLESLRATLQFLRVPETAVVQVKAFLMPMSDAESVVKEIVAFYPKDRTPAIVLVEWKSARQTPIEIELIAHGGKEYPSAPDVVDYLTPPKMSSSPIFSRIARAQYGPSIYLSGLYSRKDGDARAETEDVLEQLREILRKAGSDLHHLVKATYYVSSEGTSKALNELRPRYYDPKRPPSASKAQVAGVARPGRALTLDMIAVPSMKVPPGNPERGHGLTPQQAAEGWISLFDGATPFGWKDGLVEKGLLSRGTSSTSPGSCSIQGEAIEGGMLRVGDKNIVVKPGRFHLQEVNATGPLSLGDGLRLKELTARPLGLKPLFDGKSLTGWTRIDRDTIPENARPKWRVAGGAIVATGGPGALEYSGEKFGDLVLQLDVRTRARHANGGVFFRCIPGDFMNGYEAQVYNRCQDGDPARPVLWATGAIDDRQNARRLISRDFQSCRMTILARGAHLATWINGYQVTDWTDTRAADMNPRKGLRLEPGTLQLQAHDPLTDVEFGNILIGK